MLRDGGNNGNVFLGISGIQKSHTSSTPLGFSSDGKIDETEREGNNDTSKKKSSQQLEAGLGNVVSDEVDKHVSLFRNKSLFFFPYFKYLQESKDTVRGQMFGGVNGLESDEGNLHSKQSTSNVKDTV